MKIKTIGLGVLLSVAAAASVSRATQRCTWKLNESNPLSATAPVKHAVVWEKVGDQQKCTGRRELTLTVRKTHSEWTGKMDGKFYAITASRRPNQRSFKKSDDNTIGW